MIHFCSLLMIEVGSSLGVLEGRPGQLLFTYDQQALASGKYFTAGKMIGWSIAHNGPGPRCLNRSLYMLMCGQPVDLKSFDKDHLEDAARSCIEQVTTFATFGMLEPLRKTRNVKTRHEQITVFSFI